MEAWPSPAKSLKNLTCSQPSSQPTHKPHLHVKKHIRSCHMDKDQGKLAKMGLKHAVICGMHPTHVSWHFHNEWTLGMARKGEVSICNVFTRSCIPLVGCPKRQFHFCERPAGGSSGQYFHNILSASLSTCRTILVHAVLTIRWQTVRGWSEMSPPFPDVGTGWEIIIW
jgi:hypothetical protein